MTEDTTKLHCLNTGVFGVNTYIITLCNTYAIIVDPAACAMTRDENKIIDYIDSHNLTPLAVFLTHGHFDHIMGCGVLKARYNGIALCCHSNDELMAGSDAGAIQSNELSSMGLENLVKALDGLPDIDAAFEGGETFCDVLARARNVGNTSKSYSGELLNALSDWKIINTPGHTKGSCCFYNANENVIITGDTIFFHSYGRTDLPGGSDRDMKKGLKYLYKTVPRGTKVYPGHDRYGFLVEENYD